MLKKAVFELESSWKDTSLERGTAVLNAFTHGLRCWLEIRNTAVYSSTKFKFSIQIQDSETNHSGEVRPKIDGHIKRHFRK